MISKKLILPFILIFIGCSAGVEDLEQKNSNTQAQTSKSYIKSIRLKSKINLYQSDIESLITDKKFDIEVCLIDPIFSTPLESTEFDLSINNEHVKKHMTSKAGCLTYTTIVPYSETDSSTIIQNVLLKNDSFNLTFSIGINAFSSQIVINPDQEGIKKSFTSNNPIEIDEVKNYFSGFTTINKKSFYEKSFMSKVEFCLNFTKTGSAIKHHRFKVLIKSLDEDDIQNIENNEQEEIVLLNKYEKTNARGCIKTSYQDSFRPYDYPLRWKQKILILKSVDGSLVGKTIERRFYTNPWEPNSLYSWDSIWGAPPNIEGNLERPKLYFDKLNFNFTGNIGEGFRVNKYLDLSLVRGYHLIVEPKVITGHKYSNNSSIERIPYAKFKLEIAVFAPREGQSEIETLDDLSRFDYISGVTKTVEVIDGKLIADIKLKIDFKDLAKAASRTLGIIKISPLTEDESPASDLKPVIAAGQLYLSAHTFHTVVQTNVNAVNNELKFKPVNFSFDKLFKGKKSLDLYSRPISEWKTSPLNIFQQIHKTAKNYQSFKSYNTTNYGKDYNHRFFDFEIARMNKQGFRKTDYKKLCATLFDPAAKNTRRNKSKFNRCMEQPTALIETAQIEQIVSIESDPELVESTADRISVGTGFVIGENESTSKSKSKNFSYGAGAKVGLEIPFVKILSVNAGANYSINHVQSKAKTDSQGSSARINRDRNLTLDHIALRFQAQTKFCIAVMEKNDSRTGYIYRKLKRSIICQTNAAKREVLEHWYFIGESFSFMTLLRDPRNHFENLMVKLIRGKRTFNQFYNLLTNTTIDIFLTKQPESRAPTNYFKEIYEPKSLNRPMFEDSALPGIIEH